MNNRHVDTLVRTEFLDDNDFLITEESELLRKISVSTLETVLSFSSPINFSPRSYTGYQILGGKSVYSRRAVHLTVKSMIEAAYGSTGTNKKLKLFVLTTTFREAVFESIEDTTTAVFSDNLSTVTFEKDDWTYYDAFLISPWGLAPNTENFYVEGSQEALENRTISFSEEYAVADGSVVSGTIFIDYRPADTFLPFSVQYLDLENYLMLYYKNEKLYARLTTSSGIIEKSVDFTEGEIDYVSSVSASTGECSVVFGLETLVLQTAEGEAFGYEEGGDIYVFGVDDGTDITYFGETSRLNSDPVTIYIGKDFNNSFFYNPIYDYTNGV